MRKSSSTRVHRRSPPVEFFEASTGFCPVFYRPPFLCEVRNDALDSHPRPPGVAGAQLTLGSVGSVGYSRPRVLGLPSSGTTPSGFARIVAMRRRGWRLVCFDLDGTLVLGTSVSQHLADRLGHGALLAELERRYAAQEISNATVADRQAEEFAGRDRREMMTHLESIPRIGGIQATLARLHSAGIDALLCTVTWRFAAECFHQWYGFAAVSGTEIEEGPDGRFTGKVARHFDKYDKRDFVVEHCRRRGIDLSTCIAVGDSHSDVPMFGAVGFSVALNATDAAKAVASVSVNSGTVVDIFSVIPGL